MKNSKSSFTLVELAIVLVVIGVLLGVGATLVGVLTKRIKYSESKESVERAVLALKGYAISQGYLPVARNATAYNPSQEDPAFNEVGVSGFDAHNKALFYMVAPELNDNSTDLCNFNQTSLVITDKGSTKDNIAFMVVSAGPNFNIQTYHTIYYQGENVEDFPYDFSRTENYDDIVKYVSLNELKAQRCSYVGPPGNTTSCPVLGVNLNNINSYKKSGGMCSSGEAVFLSQPDYLETYRANNCNINTLCGNFTYSDLINYDSNRNCKVQINRTQNSCTPSDD